MAQIIIADDEPLLRFHLQKLLGELWPEADIIAQAANGEEALSLVTELTPDVVFLDIHMPGLTGLEVALQLSEQQQTPEIVFLTAYDQYALAAFERGAVDYLLKPLDEKRMMQTIARLQTRLHVGEPTLAPNLAMLLDIVNQTAPTQTLQWLNVQQGDVVKVIAVDDIFYFRAEDKYTTVVCAQGEYLARQSIKQLEDQLPSQQFWRIHRSTLINMRFIDRVEKTFTGQMQLYLQSLTKPLAVSRAKQHLFKAM